MLLRFFDSTSLDSCGVLTATMQKKREERERENVFSLETCLLWSNTKKLFVASSYSSSYMRMKDMGKTKAYHLRFDSRDA